MSPIILGGGQGKTKSGTENVPGIVGLNKALQLADSSKDNFNSHCNKLINYIREKLSGLNNNSIITPENSLSNILNVCFENFV